MNEESAFEEDAGAVLSVLGTEIAYQTWSYDFWSNVYGYKWNFLLNEYRYNGCCFGGGRGIRTPEDLAALTDFKSVGFNHSPIPP